MYHVKDLFKTLQGEGARTGRCAVFCRFAGCNLWTGREADRESATCRFCDTDFVGAEPPRGGRFERPEALAERIADMWGADCDRRYVVFTGGEPLLQLDAALIAACHALGFEVAVETNGTLDPPPGIDWLCVSPKAGAPWRMRSGNELKLIYPQPELPPDGLTDLRFSHFWLQPMDGPDQATAIAAAAAYCMAHPRWRLSLQTHKLIGIP